MGRTVRAAALALVASIGFGAGEARAELILIDPDAYALGTDLSTLFTGMSMQRITQLGSGSNFYDPVVSGVFAAEHHHAPGQLTLGAYASPNEWAACEQASLEGRTSFACVEGFSVLELRFDSPTDFVEITSAWFSDGPGVRAYDVQGNEIARCSTPFGGDGGGCASTLPPNEFGAHATTSTIAREQRDISRIVFGGLTGISTPTEVRYRVPEPSTLLLMALGCAGLLRRARR